MKPFEWARLVCADDRVPPMARFVAVTLAMHARGAHAPQSRCSHAQLAEWTGLSKRTIVTAIASLVECDYLVSLRQNSKSGARAASLHLLIHPPDPVDNPVERKVTKVQEVHHHGAGDALRQIRAQGERKPAPDLRRYPESLSAAGAHLEDKESPQDAAHVVDLIARMAQGTRF